MQPRPGFRWERVKWGGPNQVRTAFCSYCGDELSCDDDDFMPLILSRPDGSAAEFCDDCQATWWGIAKFDVPAEDRAESLPLAKAGDGPELGPCCICQGPGSRTIILLARRGAVPGHGWGCVVCGLPADGAVAVLCDWCVPKYERDAALLTHACRGHPASDGRIPIAELPAGEFKHDRTKHSPED